MIIIQILWVVMCLFIWFNTTAFIEYTNLIRPLRDYFKIKEYFDYKNRYAPEITYLSFMRQSYNNFFTRLFSCPMCTSFWFSVVAVICCCNYLMFPIIYLGSFVLYKLLNRFIFTL